MKEKTADILSISLPPEDGSIDRAFAELGARLSAWSAAFSQAQDGLRQMDARHAVGSGDPVTCCSDPVGVEMDGGVMTATADPLSTESTESPQPSESEVEKVTEADRRPDEPSDIAPTPPVRQDADDDEEFLATLDPETVNAIRIRRRLSPEKKSVRQMLDAYLVSRPAIDPAVQQKKTWWTKRGQ